MSQSLRAAPALLAALLLTVPASGLAQQAEVYRTPPAPIAQIIDADPTPAIVPSRDRSLIAVAGRENLPSIAAVSDPILRLAGMRLNPRTNGPIEARTSYLRSLTFIPVKGGAEVKARLPAGMRGLSPAWSPDGRWLAIMGESKDGLELWVVNARTGEARQAADVRLNAAFGTAYS